MVLVSALALPGIIKILHFYVDETRVIALRVLPQTLKKTSLSKRLDLVAARWTACIWVMAATVKVKIIFRA